MEEQHSRLAGAVIDAASEFNQAVNKAADAGILIDVSVENSDPDLTIGAVPRPELIVRVLPKDHNPTNGHCLSRGDKRRLSVTMKSGAAVPLYFQTGPRD